jgi:hypothetical protein
MKYIAIVLALLGLGFGVLAAYWWWRSSRTEFRISGTPIIMHTGPAVGLNDVENYLSEVGRLNKLAAIFTAISVLLSTASSVVGSLG